jgi:hypothetical protein
LEILNSSGEGGVFDGACLTQSLKAIGTNIFGLVSMKVKFRRRIAAGDAVKRRR